MQKKLNKCSKQEIETQENLRFSGPQKSERFFRTFEYAKFIEALTFEQLKRISVKNDYLN